MKRSFWINLCLANLCIVAFLGFGLRSKILFPLHFINFRYLESAHSHFAFAGWAGLSLITMLIYDILPAEVSVRKIYQYILSAIEISALGMAVIFPFFGYNIVSECFSTLYILAACVFIPVYIKDLLKFEKHPSIRLLGISSLGSLLLSFLGTAGLLYILSAKSGNSLLYRDSIYTFLHFQYNGFFTLGLFALFFNYLNKKQMLHGVHAKLFALFLCLSIIPALFLSLLWHNQVLFYILGSTGCLLMLISLAYFIMFFSKLLRQDMYSIRFARRIWMFSMLSFILKTILNAGTIIPQLGNAVYGDRPVIIGFLHLVFLGFLTFYILSMLTEQKYFSRNSKLISYPIIIFSTGIFANEILLMLQGLGILFMFNNQIYTWLLWGASIILFSGALLMIITRLAIVTNKKAMESHGSLIN